MNGLAVTQASVFLFSMSIVVDRKDYMLGQLLLDVVLPLVLMVPLLDANGVRGQ